MYARTNVSYGNGNLFSSFSHNFPLGPKLIEKVRPDLIKKFSTLTEGEDVSIAEYIFHCNAQNPT